MEQRRGKKNIDRMVAKYLEEEENKKWLDERTRACAGCGVRVEKSHGCNHMTCGRCGAHFCYRCGASVSFHRGMISAWHKHARVIHTTRVKEEGERADHRSNRWTRTNTIDGPARLALKSSLTKKRLPASKERRRCSMREWDIRMGMNGDREVSGSGEMDAWWDESRAWQVLLCVNSFNTMLSIHLMHNKVKLTLLSSRQ
jgi:predicted RNA-binding Zn-ribbon protein involved in translation (DUF1610 family)